MNELNKLLFELIRVTIGTQDRLSRFPSACEWGKLYKMAEKQSLVGICFAGLQSLGADGDDGFTRIGMSEMQYLDWMGVAAQIQLKNEITNSRCSEIHNRLIKEGFKNCILKGQGVASLYSNELKDLRQTGDIDVLMWKEGLSEKDNKNAVIEYAQRQDVKAKASEHHIAVKIFEDTEIEMHYSPAYLCNPFANKRFKEWCISNRNVTDSGIGFTMPDAKFNIVFLLAHAFRHYLGEGIGMRQMMDYYYVVKAFDNKGDKFGVRELLNSFNMLKFAGAVMWVMHEVFGLEKKSMICETNERLGRKLLDHIMEGGNFGHHNKKKIASKKTHYGRFLNQVMQDMRLAFDYPAEALWAPISMIREFIRIRI